MNTTPAILGQPPLFKDKIPIAKPHLATPAELSAEITKVLASGVLTNGPHTAALEANVAKHLGVKHAIAVSSATAGLMLTFRALELSGEVVVPSFTFMATAGALVWCGLRPVFADIDLHTANLDPAMAEAAITTKTSAIVAVHNSGNPADIEQLVSLAKRYSVRLVFDAAHAFGSLYQGKPVGQQGDAQVFSLTPTKLVTGGEGGIVATDDDQVAERVRVGRNYGNRGDYSSDSAGLSARLPEVNALIAGHSLRGLEEAAQHRNHIATLYRERLGKLLGIDFQKVRAGDRSSFKDFSIAIDADNFGLSRNQLAAALTAENIETRAYYDPPVHRQKAYQSYALPDSRLPNTDLLSGTILNLPVWSEMQEAIAHRVCLAVERAHALGDVTTAPPPTSV
jgi:dTDP-4-amino-4,6-dideoxygalactose transaminase